MSCLNQIFKKALDSEIRVFTKGFGTTSWFFLWTMTKSSYFLGWYESHSFPSGLEFSSDHRPASTIDVQQPRPVLIIPTQWGTSPGLLCSPNVTLRQRPWQVLTDHAGKTRLHLVPGLEVTCLWLCFPNQARSSWGDLSLIDLSRHQGPHPTWDVAAAQQIVDQNLNWKRLSSASVSLQPALPLIPLFHFLSLILF